MQGVRVDSKLVAILPSPDQVMNTKFFEVVAMLFLLQLNNRYRTEPTVGPRFERIYRISELVE